MLKRSVDRYHLRFLGLPALGCKIRDPMIPKIDRIEADRASTRAITDDRPAQYHVIERIQSQIPPQQFRIMLFRLEGKYLTRCADQFPQHHGMKANIRSNIKRAGPREI